MIAKTGIVSPEVKVFFSSLDDTHLCVDDDAHVQNTENHWLKFLRSKKISAKRILFMNQVHGSTVTAVDGTEATLLPRTDALLTNTPEIFLAVKGADCLPLLLFDEKQSVVAALHAGWRGTLAGITEATVSALCQKYGSDPKNIRAILGPCICAKCYNVADSTDDRILAFEEKFGAEAVWRRGNMIGLDLRFAQVAILRDAGILPTSIAHIDDCTAHGIVRFPSFYGRKEQKRFVSVIGITNAKK